MSIWQRISTLVKSNINALISGAEDPEKILNQLIATCVSSSSKRGSRSPSLSLTKSASKAVRQRAKKAADWETKAMTAISQP